MFGNRLGWGISAVLAALLLLLLNWVVQQGAMSQPSHGVVARTGNVALNLTEHPETLDVIQLPFNPQAILPTMTAQEDSAPLYRKAIDEFKSDKYTYRDLFETGKPKTTSYKDLPAIEFIVEARNMRNMKLFAAQPRQSIGYDKASLEPIESLYYVGKSASRMALYIQKEQPADALILAESVFSLGVKLCEERIRWREFEAGAELLRDGAYLIKKIDPARAQAAEIDAAMKDLLEHRWIPLWTVIGSIDQDVIARTAGDIFYIAKNSRERLWRIEATLKLGRYKYNAGTNGRRGNQQWAKLTVKRMAQDTTLDPALRAAAQAANDLTFPQFNMIGS
jgi:hypothetical protein